MPKWQPHDYAKPTSENDYFERMARVVFMSGLNWATLEKKWPGIKLAFHNFDIDTVSALSDTDIDALMYDPAVIRNRSKIQAIITNAREFQAVKDEFGGFGAYLTSLRQQGGEKALRDAIAKRFAFMGKGTTVIFLFSVGEDLPEAHREWDDLHK